MLPAGSKAIAKVVKGELCSGCGLCASLSGGRMEAVPPGYNRPAPTPPVSPAIERILAGSCPGSKVAPWHDAPHVHEYWGPYHQVLGGYATDEAVRHQASSGGGITAFAVHALRSGMVDRVMQIRADPERPTRNVATVSRTVEQVIEGSGSRYAASSPLEEIDRELSAGGRIAFIGKPCDASALRQLGTFDKRVEAHVKLVLAFFCAGIPSERGALNILRELEMHDVELAEFRYRGFGWPGRATAIGRDGRSADMSYADSWGGHLSKEVQFRCKICPDAVGGVADIACADAWYGGETGYPKFDELSGRSLIVTRTARGEEVLKSALAAGEVEAEPLGVEEIDLMQPSQVRRKRLIRARTAAVRANLQPIPEMKGLKVGEAAARAGAKEQLQNFVGTARRVVTGKR
jgi:coenzyme F420 hydrogenase subunit beta